MGVEQKMDVTGAFTDGKLFQNFKLLQDSIGPEVHSDFTKLDLGLVHLYVGTAATRAAVRALVGDSAPRGSVFIAVSAVATTKPNFYVKVLDGPGDTDWERVTTAATD